MSSDDRFTLTLWTGDPLLARAADAAGIDRIGVDLERIGKEERQRSRGTWISPHREDDLDALAPALSHASLFARVNPIHDGSAREIESVLARGASVLMLPMVMTPGDATEFVRLARGRATTVLLVEHIDALRNLGAIAAVAGVDEVHIGLNDLAISLGMRSRWMTLAGDLIAEAAAVVLPTGRRFGFGGIGRAGDVDLPVPSDLIYAEYARTGARAALISRSFFNGGGDLAKEVAKARAALGAWTRRSREEMEAAHQELARCGARAEVW